ncbi:uncharacterized protein LOC117167395 isoform X2 [Belonocnema kinseyi]|nr:uncharacterized protein LOC117167395 isoform X2 [Belonocnema kinseyi]XP_033208207.1 uncharacterized protein LOC117167395 isoform X2 [Belonocnema kinseyi]
MNDKKMLISTPISKKFQKSSPSISEEPEDFNLVQESSFSSEISKSEGLEMKSLNDSLDSQTEDNQSFLANLNIKSEKKDFIASDNNLIKNQEKNFENFESEIEENLTKNRGISYTPERLVKLEEYKIISPPLQSAFIHSSKYRQTKLSELIDREQIGASYLEILLCPRIAEIKDYSSFDSAGFAVKNEINNQNGKGLSSGSSDFEKLKSLCLKEKGRNHKFSFEEKDTSRIQSTGWSPDISSDLTQVPLRLQELSNLLSSSPEEEQFFFEDAEIDSDYLENLPNVIQDQENLFQLQSRVERLRAINENIHKDIGTLKEDFQIEEWKVQDLLEDTSNFRREMQDLKYLDDLLNLLQGELERITQKSWPFISGHVDPYSEEINLIV